jgi:DNA polymerase III sliding clamp (beta) subunit (PCNA family)
MAFKTFTKYNYLLDEDEEEEKVTPSQKARDEQKKKREYKTFKELGAKAEAFVEPTPKPEIKEEEKPSDGILEKAKRFVTGLFKREEEPEEEVPEFETIEPSALRDVLIQEERQMVQVIDDEVTFKTADVEDVFLREMDFDKEETTVYDSLGEEAVGGFVAGVGDVIAGTGQAVRWLGYEQAGSQLVQKGGEYKIYAPTTPEELEEFDWKDVTNPRFWTTQVSRGVPFTLAAIPMFYAGAYVTGTAVTATGISGISALILKTIGASVLPTAYEAAVEAGGVYDEALGRGQSREEADKAADKTFKGTASVLSVSNTLQFLPFLRATKADDILIQRIISSSQGWIKKTAKGIVVAGLEIATEGLEEVLQEKVARESLGDEFDFADTETQRIFALGGLQGLVFTAGGAIINTTTGRNQTKDFVDVGILDAQNTVAEIEDRVIEETNSQARVAKEGRQETLEKISKENPKVVERVTQEVVSRKVAEEEGTQPKEAKAPTIGTLTEKPTLFRGAKEAKIDVTRGDALSKGAFLTSQAGIAESFAARIGGEVRQYELTKSPEKLRVVQASELEAFSVSREARDKFLDDNNIDIVVYDLKEGELGEGEFRIINPDIIKEVEVTAKPPVKPPEVPKDLTKYAVARGYLVGEEKLDVAKLSQLEKAAKKPKELTIKKLDKKLVKFYGEKLDTLKAELEMIDAGEYKKGSLSWQRGEAIRKEIAELEKALKAVPTKPPEPIREPKKKKKVKPPKKKAKPRTTITGGEIKRIPSAKVEMVWRTVKPRNAQLPILENVRVKDGQVLMTDLEISAAINTQLKDGMYKVVGKDFVALDPKLKLEQDFPTISDPKNVVAQSLPENLVQGIKQAAYHASKDETRPMLTGIKFEFEKNKVRLVTTDGFRLFNRTFGVKGKKKASFVVGGMVKLNRILNNVTKDGGVVDIAYDKKNNLVSFKNNNGRIVVREIKGEFPPYKKIYPETNRRIIIDKKAFKEGVKDISAYAKQTANIAVLEIQEAQVLLKAKDIEGTEKVVELPIKGRDDKEIDGVVEGVLIMPIRGVDKIPFIQLNYRYLQDTLQALTDDDIYLSYRVDEKGVIDNDKPIPVSDRSEAVIEKIKREKPLEEKIPKKVPLARKRKPMSVQAQDFVVEKSKTMSIKEINELVGSKRTKYVDMDMVEKYLKERPKAPSGVSQASIDKFADIKNVANQMSYYKAIEFPEILRMVRELTGEIPSVSYPRHRPTLGGRPLGLFIGDPLTKGKIILNPDLFESPEQAVKTFAHEVGHLADWLPQKTLKRGNLIGHVASLTHFLRHTFAGVANEARIDSLKAEEAGATKSRKAQINKEIDKLRKNPEFTLEEVKAELKKLTQIWKPFDEEALIEGGNESYVNYRYKSAELYADAVSVLFNDPIMLKENAPVFYKAFFNALDRKPKVKKVYFDTMDLLNEGKEAVLGQRHKDVRAMFQKGEDLNRAKLEEQKVQKYNYLVRLKTQIANENQAMIEIVKRREKRGEPFADEEHPLHWLEENNYIGGKVKAFVETNIQPIVEEIERSGATWEDFGEVLLLERIIKERGGTRNPIKILRQLDKDLVEGGFQDFLEQHKDKLPKEVRKYSSKQFLNVMEKKSSDYQLQMLKTIFGDMVNENGDSAYDELIQRLPMGIANPLGLDVESATEQLEFLKGKLGDRYSVIERNLPKFRTAIKSLLPEAAEAELYKEKLVKQMIANEGYATFQVLDYLDSYIPASVKRQVGTLKEVANPATSTVQKTISIVRAIERNRTKRVLVQTLKQEKGEIQDAKTIWTGQAHIPIDPKDRNLALVTLMEKGKYKGYYVDNYIANSFRRVSTGQSNAVLQTLRFFNTKLWRPLFVVYSLRFQTKNLWRDFMRTYKNTPNLSLVKALKIYATALKPSVKRNLGISDKTITEMENAKILSGFTYGDLMRGGSVEDTQIERMIEKVGLSPLRQKKRNFFLKAFMFLPKLIAGIGNTIETIPKVAAYQELQGKMPTKEMGSFIRNYVGTPDLLKRGTATPFTNNILLFSNPMIQGITADYHIATDPKTRMGWIWKTAMTTLLPKILMFAAQLGLFGLGLRELMEKASEYDKTNYNIIPLGEDENGRAIYLRIPQDESGRTIGGMFWKALGATEDKKLTLTDAVQLFSYLGGDIPSVTPTISNLAAIAQFASGRNPYDAYRGRYVIPQQEFEAGGKYALKPFMTWLWRQSGGNIFYTFGATYQAPETNTWLQDKYEIPVVGEILKSWVKTSDYGQVEKNREITDEVRKLRSIELLEQEEIIDKYIEMHQKGEGGGKTALERELVKEILGTTTPKSTEDKRQKTNIKKKFQVGILRGEADPNMNSLISSSTNAQKLELLKVLKRTISGEEYNELIKVAKDNKVISDDVYKKAKKL